MGKGWIAVGLGCAALLGCDKGEKSGATGATSTGGARVSASAPASAAMGASAPVALTMEMDGKSLPVKTVLATIRADRGVGSVYLLTEDVGCDALEAYEKEKRGPLVSFSVSKQGETWVRDAYPAGWSYQRAGKLRSTPVSPDAHEVTVTKFTDSAIAGRVKLAVDEVKVSGGFEGKRCP